LSHFLIFKFQKPRRAAFLCKSCLVGDLKDFDFFDLERLRTREKRALVQSGVVGVSLAKARTATAGVCVAVIANINVTRIITKAWTTSGITIDCPPLLFSLECKSPLTDVVPILQTENETLQTVIRLNAIVFLPALPVPLPRFPLRRGKSTEDVPLSVENNRQCVCVTVASAVKFRCTETIPAASPQKFELFSAEFGRDERKL
jgi:hypothetical protein